ncbi:uncharacterized protein LOC131886034 [Tigriopus californicus]|uniref:uncharacterized protein LOC131886034 n=1 Tax=Tigriopus californicus TaxID=6832 RepID=UPI0027D9FF7C|nr:uncharacterized protein LOC131886034 [Tigriopus californicus]|eukprot:TCALIF_02357-PA protein Name:"Protein of unknown function" AED:0.00 eAED:0.00 QI:16/1/1/1/1/1/3/78/131
MQVTKAFGSCRTNSKLLVVLQILGILLSMFQTIQQVEGGRNPGNCGLSCYRWKKCKGKMSELSSTSSSVRPGQSGTTGQLFFNKCGDPPSNCPCEYEEPHVKPKKPAMPRYMSQYIEHEASMWLRNHVEFF